MCMLLRARHLSAVMHVHRRRKLNVCMRTCAQFLRLHVTAAAADLRVATAADTNSSHLLFVCMVWQMLSCTYATICIC